MWAGYATLPRTKDGLRAYDPSYADVTHAYSDWLGAYHRHQRALASTINPTDEFSSRRILPGGFFKRLAVSTGLGAFLTTDGDVFLWVAKNREEEAALASNGGTVVISNRGSMIHVDINN